MDKGIGPYDLQIAATALAHDCVLITHNTEEFVRVPGLRLDDWEKPPPTA
jgi:tRNA(fMet)-specific endonuclease VapC